MNQQKKQLLVYFDTDNMCTLSLQLLQFGKVKFKVAKMCLIQIIIDKYAYRIMFWNIQFLISQECIDWAGCIQFSNYLQSFMLFSGSKGGSDDGAGGARAPPLFVSSF